MSWSNVNLRSRSLSAGLAAGELRVDRPVPAGHDQVVLRQRPCQVGSTGIDDAARRDEVAVVDPTREPFGAVLRMLVLRARRHGVGPADEEVRVDALAVAQRRRGPEMRVDDVPDERDAEPAQSLRAAGGPRIGQRSRPTTGLRWQNFRKS